MEQPMESGKDLINRIINQGDESWGDLDEDCLYETYGNMVEQKAKPGADIAETMTPEKLELWHMGTGISTEAGELLDAIKKHCIYNKALDVENIIEELGDLMFYTVGAIQWLQRNVDDRIVFERILETNMLKLNKRYKGKYSDQEAQQRADKNEETKENTDIFKIL